MKIIWNDYTTRAAADDAVARVVGIGVPHEDVVIIRPALATRQVAADQGSTAPSDVSASGRQGSFADTEADFHDRSVERQGSFADSEPVFHDRNTERQGSFADVDPEIYDSHTERQGSFADVDIGSGDDATLTRVLTSAGIAEHELGIAAASLHQGHMLVVVHAPNDVAEQVAHIIR